MTKIIILSTIYSSVLFLISYHPIMMIMNLILSTILVSLMTTLLMKTSWFSYTLFLIMLGGMLVVFIYIASLAPNESFKMLTKIPFLIIPSMPLLFTTISFKTSIFPEMYKISISKIFSNLPMMTTLFLVTFLLITLIAVVKITKISQGPIRHN
uniref:NADH-ubiquinone oxidoreductase chain 6 n=1 Tax=Limulus polyphemus TaxID=6850 RepID=K9S3W2_LIMPO|nr:NADH dehydrogenase subunit 6 [Limulus polyphemus]